MHALLAVAQVSVLAVEARMERLIAQHSEDVASLRHHASEEVKALHLCISRYRHACAKLHAIVRGCGACENKYLLRVKESERMLIDDCEEAWVEARITDERSPLDAQDGLSYPEPEKLAEDSDLLRGIIDKDFGHGVDCDCDSCIEAGVAADMDSEELRVVQAPRTTAVTGGDDGSAAHVMATPSGQVLLPTGVTLRMMQTDFVWDDSDKDGIRPRERQVDARQDRRPPLQPKATLKTASVAAAQRPISSLTRPSAVNAGNVRDTRVKSKSGDFHVVLEPLSAPRRREDRPESSVVNVTEDEDGLECSVLAEGLNTPGYVHTHVKVNIIPALREDSKISSSAARAASTPTKQRLNPTLDDGEDDVLSVLNPSVRDANYPSSVASHGQSRSRENTSMDDAQSMKSRNTERVDVLSHRENRIAGDASQTPVDEAPHHYEMDEADLTTSPTGEYDSLLADMSYNATLSDAQSANIASAPTMSGRRAAGERALQGQPNTVMVEVPEQRQSGLTPPLTPVSPHFELKVSLPRRM